MRRALIVTGAAVVGVAWIANYKIATHTAGIVAPPAETPATTPSARSSGPVSGSFLGSDVPNRFGDVQVRVVRSEERRVGKECRCRGSGYPEERKSRKRPTRRGA